MKRVWQISAQVLAGLVFTAMYAMPQAYTISARPGAVNYIEGDVYINGHPVSQKNLRQTFLNSNDILSTDKGKAEVLLTPGVFLRLGDNSEIRMISPSLTNTQLEVGRGEAMIEVAQLVKDNSIQVIDHGGSITLKKAGLYRFTAGDPPTASTIDGKAEVAFGDKKVKIGKGRQTVIAANLKSVKFDRKKEDDLYAWSNVRSEYNSAASYAAARSVAANSYGGWGGFGFGGWYNPGWYWNSGFNSWAWLPGDGAFFSPFGWGFYSPLYAGYAPIVYAPIVGGGHLVRPGHGYVNGHGIWTQGGKAAVPVNPGNPPALSGASRSPWANGMARRQAARALRQQGFTNANGAHVSAFPSGRTGFAGRPQFSGAPHTGYHGGGGRPGGFSGGHPGGVAGHAGGGGGHATPGVRGR